MHAHAQGIDLISQPTDDGADVGAARCAGGDGHLPAEPLGGLVQFNIVSSKGCGAGELQARRAAAHHEYPLRLRCLVLRIKAELVLPSRRVVDDATNLAAGHQLADAAHVGADAGTDAMRLGVAGLVDQVGVGDQRAHHGHHLRRAAGDDVLGVIEGHDAPHHHDRALQPRCNDLVGGHFHAERVVRRGDQLVKPPIGAHVQGDVIGLVIDGGGDAGAVRSRDAAGHMVFVGQPHAHGELAAVHHPAHCGDDLAQEAQPILERAAVAVGALVQGGGQELVQQVAAGSVDVHSVEARIPAAAGGVREVRHHVVDHGLGHGNGHHPRHWVGHGACRPVLRHPGLGRIAGAGMVELQEQLHAGGADAAADLGEERQATVIPELQPAGRQGVDAGGFDGGHPDAASPPGFVVGDERLAAQARAVGRAHDAVADGDRPDLDRLEQRVVEAHVQALSSSASQDSRAISWERMKGSDRERSALPYQ